MNDYIDHLINESKTLCQNSYQSGTALEMVKALEQIKEVLKNHPDARWGTPLNKSNKNLVWVTKKLFNPILGKIKTEFEMSALDALGFDEKSRLVDISEIQNSIELLSKSVKLSDEALLQIYSSFLGFIKLRYSPKRINKNKFSNILNCKYCFRELWLTTLGKRLADDTCHVHSDQWQKMGKYHEVRYKKIFIEINKMSMSEIPYSYMLNLLTLKDIPAWIPLKDDLAWIENLLRALDVCPESCAARISQERYNELPQALPAHYHRYWPVSLNSTIIKYAAYTLATMRYPSKKTAEKLAKMWLGNEISTLSEYGVTTKSLYPLRKRWGEVICLLRVSGLPESLISLTLNIKISDLKLSTGKI